MRRTRTFLILAVWATLASCHRSPPRTLAEACEVYAAAVCARVDDCGGSFAFGIGGDLCAPRVALWCTNNGSIPGTSFQIDKLVACADEVGGLDCLAVGGPHDSGGKACGALFRGTVPKREPCSIDIQCEGGACRMNSADTCGVCAGLAHEGDDCATAAVVCDSGLYCSTQTWKCTKLAGAGASCQEVQASCTDGLWCVGGTCVPQLGEGDSCTSITENTCSPELVCDDTGHCGKEVVTVKAIGENCFNTSLAHANICAPGAFCEDPSSPDTVCAPTVPDGQGCSTRGENPCLFPSKCVDGVCGPPDPFTCP